MIKAPKLTINYDRKKVGSATNAAPVVVEVYHAGKRKYFDTGVRVCPSEWNDSIKTVVEAHCNADALNHQITECRKRVESLIYDALGENGRFSLEVLSQLYNGERSVEQPPQRFAELLERLTEVGHRRNSSEMALRSYIATIKQYAQIETLEQISEHTIKAFDKRLHDAGKKDSYIVVLHSVMRRATRYALREGLIAKDPYDTFRPKQAKATRIRYLKTEDLDALKGLKDLNEIQEIARDRFLIQVYTGLSVVDLDKSEFDLERGILRDTRQKTGTEFVVKLLRPALNILRRYGCCPKQNYSLYRITLLELGRMIGVEPLTSHMGRHTFATTIALSNKVPLPIVSKMLGHTNITTTQRYAKVLAEDVLNEFDRLDELDL